MSQPTAIARAPTTEPANCELCALRMSAAPECEAVLALPEDVLVEELPLVPVLEEPPEEEEPVAARIPPTGLLSEACLIVALVAAWEKAAKVLPVL